MIVVLVKEYGGGVLLTAVGWGEGEKASPFSPFLEPPPVRGLLREHLNCGHARVGHVGKPMMGEAEASMLAHVCTRGCPGRQVFVTGGERHFQVPL